MRAMKEDEISADQQIIIEKLKNGAADEFKKEG